MSGRVLAGLAAAVIAVLVVCAGLGGAVTGGFRDAAGCIPHSNSPTSSGSAETAALLAAAAPPSGYPGIGRWDPVQVGNAVTIIAVGARRGMPVQGWVIAVATAMQESSLRNLPGGDRDSVGLFQQRPSQGWGTPVQLRDPDYASSRFYAKLITIAGWQTMPLAHAAQAVQHSGDGSLYANDEPDARLIVQRLTGFHDSSLGCDTSVGPQGWVAPVDAPVVSGFRTRERPGHDGVDLGAQRGTDIRAAAAGTVTVATCNVDPPSHGCDRDGSPDIRGCGYYVQIDHGHGIGTIYCHLLRKPAVTVGQRVTAGQSIGHVGSSGNSSGEHLHFEVQVHGASTDPAIWMHARQAPLGKGTVSRWPSARGPRVNRHGTDGPRLRSKWSTIVGTCRRGHIRAEMADHDRCTTSV